MLDIFISKGPQVIISSYDFVPCFGGPVPPYESFQLSRPKFSHGSRINTHLQQMNCSTRIGVCVLINWLVAEAPFSISSDFNYRKGILFSLFRRNFTVIFTLKSTKSSHPSFPSRSSILSSLRSSISCFIAALGDFPAIGGDAATRSVQKSASLASITVSTAHSATLVRQGV